MPKSPLTNNPNKSTPFAPPGQLSLFWYNIHIMKIALICPYSVARGGGVQEIIYALRERLAGIHDVRIITPRPKDFDGNEINLAKTTFPNEKFTAKNQPFIFIGRGSDISLRTLKTTGQISGGEKTEIRDVLTRERFDVMHFHEPWVPFLSAQLLQINAKMEAPAKTVATFHAKLPESIGAKTFSQITRPYTKPILKYIDKLTAVSPAAAETISALTDRHITVIPNGIDLTKYVPADPKQVAKNTILYVGRLEARKGVKYLISAFVKILETNPDAKLVLAGNGTDRKKLEQFVYFHKIRNVEFLGFVSDEKKLELLRTCTVFCSPALYGESFGIVLLEAMACGAPIVAGDNSGYTGVMRDFGEISLVNPRHIDDFARRLAVFLREESLRKTWRQWAAKEIKQYDYDRVTKLYEQTYTH